VGQQKFGNLIFKRAFNWYPGWSQIPAKQSKMNTATPRQSFGGAARHVASTKILSIFTLLACLATAALATPVIYKASAPAKGKKLVLLASDHEYRSEETIPALARILAKHHGFDCTVLFGLDANGEIEAGISNVPGLEALKDADGLVIFARFLALPPEQMKHLDEYFNRAGPVVGLRTSTHAFNYKDDKDPYYKYHFRYDGKDYNAGFGHQVLGQSWVGHYGRNHQQSTRITIVPAAAKNPILRGVKDIHVQAGGYNAEPQKDWNVLTMAQPLMSMDFNGKPDAAKPPMASEWTRTYNGKNGKTGRAFTSLYGASEDILNDGYRRMIVNGVYWSVGLENSIKADSKIDFLGPYKPNTFRGKGEAKGIKPIAYNGFTSPIPANHNTAAPAKPKTKPKRVAKNKPTAKKEAKPVAPAKPAAKGAQTARFVRIELPGKKRILTLAEVEIVSGGKNVARGGKATQSSVNSGGVAARAIDGNKSSDWGKGGQTHTDNGGTTKPWWEIDLGKDVAIEKVQVWNRQGFESRLDKFSVTLLDAKRKTVFQKKDIVAGQSVVIDITDKKAKPVYLTFAGKPGKAISRGRVQPTDVEPDIAEVPANYKDPLPFKFTKGDVIAIVGNGLADRMQHDGWMEALLQNELSKHQLTFRNMSLAGDRPNLYPRSKGYTPMTAYLQHVKADVVFAMFGYNESFAGADKTDDYHKLLLDFVKKTRGSKANGKSFPRIVLFSPIAHENLNDPNLPDGTENNKRLAAYAKATEAAAKEAGVAYVDLFTPSAKLFTANGVPLTINGIHLNEQGNRRVGEMAASSLLGHEINASASLEDLRKAVLDKNTHWHNRYRATDGNDVWGGRSTLKFVDDQTNAEVLQHELKMFDVMTANRDRRIWARANGTDIRITDDNVPAPVKVISNIGGGSRSSNAMKEGNANYFNGQEGIKQIALRDGYEIKLFADERRFPGLVNPVQMQVDTKGRLWAAAWPTYPKWEPLKEMNDALLIFPDENRDGVADKVIEFARVHNPLGFEFWNGGVLVTSMPDILFLKDTDGDDIADVREVIFHGIGSSDTHHAANNLIMGPDGGIYWQSGIFLQHNHENPWGPALAATQSGMYRFDPRRHTIALHGANSPNPHGISFDGWGYHYATDGTGGRAYQVRPEGKGWKMHPLLVKEVRPVCANEIISSANFPDDVQGDFILCNAIGFLGIKQYKLHRDGGYKLTRTEGRGKNAKQVSLETKLGEVWGTPNGGELKVSKKQQDGTIVTEESTGLMMSGDKNFRPTDAVFGSDGALYISDWQNVIIGHMQHNVRDPNRDHKHGRIYRMVAKGRPLQKAVKIDGQPLMALLDNLKHPVDGVRHRTRVELSERNSKEVIAATQTWMKQFDPKKESDAHHLLEALWVHQQHNVRDNKLLNVVLTSPVAHARKAAQTVQHHWYNADPAAGAVQVQEKVVEVTQKSGILKDTADLTVIRIATIVEKMSYDTKELTVKAGKKIQLTFANPDFMPHNIVLVNPGKADAIAMQALTLGARGFEIGFVPESKDILWSSKLIDHGKEQVIEFTAPTKPGDYPYVCTFPGHHMLMRGMLHVR
jgi:putative membrane-bound dehydrogenase-like protein